MAKLEIDIYSDAICPWCYIGKRRLGKALQSLGIEQSTVVRWHPFELNSQMPDAGMNRKEYRSQKFGSWEKSLVMDQQIAEAGRTEDLSFAFDRMQRTPNTAKAHRLVAFARRMNVEDAIVESIFHAYFSEGRDIGDPEVLRQIATENGLDGERAIDYIENPDSLRELRAAESKARSLGLQGVPFFLFNGRRAISGAQPPQVFAALIREFLQEEEHRKQTIATGTQCLAGDPTC